MLRFDHLRTCSRHPRIWLAAQLLAVVAAGGVFGLWHLKLPLEGDSVSYVATSKMPFLQALTSMRTLGYPLLLKAVALVSPNYIVIPWIHLGMFCAAIFFFDFALRRFGASPWQAVLASSALIYALLPLRTPIGLVLTDFPGEVLAVTTVGCLFWIAAEPRRPLGWLLMTVCLLAAYQVRPVYLFLVPLTPCLGLWFMWLRTQHAGIAFAWKRPLAGLLAASCLPLAAFCLMRLALVGSFGLVSFAGYNLSGLAVEMLDSSLAERELPPRFRPLAREILKERQERGLHNAFVHGRWDLARYELNFSPNIYGIAVPTVKRLYGDEPTMVNRELADFSRQVIALRKGRYLLWVAYSIPRAAAKAACFDWIILPLAAIAALLVLRRVMFSAWPACAGCIGSRAGPDMASMFFLLAILFFFSLVAVLCLSGTYLDSRIVVPAGVFLPSWLALVIADELALLRAAPLSRSAGSPRLLYVTTSMPFGNTETFLIPEVQELRRQGWELLIVPRDHYNTLINHDASDLEAICTRDWLVSWNILLAAAAELLRHPLRCLGGAALLLRSRSAVVLAKNLIVYPKALWLARLARNWKADHIHVQWASTTATMAMLAGHISGIPWSCTAHRGDIAENNLLRTKATRASFMRFISASGLRMAQGFGVPAAATNTPVIHMGVTLPPERAPAPSQEGLLKAICPANLFIVKGHKYLLQALTILRERGLEISLDIAGEGELEAELKALTAELRLDNCVRFTGFVPHDKLLELYNSGKIDLLVLPSVSLPNNCHEGIPVSLMEAMACGIPVLSTTTGGIPELLHDGAGVMAPPQDAGALADALERLVRDPALRRQLAVAGRRRIEEEFSVAASVSKLSLCIRAACQGRHGPKQ